MSRVGHWKDWKSRLRKKFSLGDEYSIRKKIGVNVERQMRYYTMAKAVTSKLPDYTRNFILCLAV